MRVNYIFKITTLENNRYYSHIIQKVEKGKQDLTRPVNSKCTIEFMNQTQLRQKFGNHIELLYGLKTLHYNNGMLIWKGYNGVIPMCRVTSMEIIKREVEENDKDRANIETSQEGGK